MTEKYRSQTLRKGEPEDHQKAVKFVSDFLGRYWDKIFHSLPSIYAPYGLSFPDRFVLANKLKYFVHAYDIGCTLYGIRNNPIMIVEIGALGDNSKHNPAHKQQLINDGIAEKYIKENYPFCKFYRLNKDDSLIESFLVKTFFRYGDRSKGIGN